MKKVVVPFGPIFPSVNNTSTILRQAQQLAQGSNRSNSLTDARTVRPYNLWIISSASIQESNETAHNFLPRSLTDAPT